MPLTPDQFRASVDYLTGYFERVPETDRQPFVTYALVGSDALKDVTYTGNASTFATNLVRHLQLFDESASLIAVLRYLQTKVGDPRRSKIGDLTGEIGRDAAPEASLPPSAASPIDFTSYVFISYSHDDSQFVDRLRADLANAGIAVWIDKEGLVPGTPNWEHGIRRAIKESQSIIWVVSPASFASEYVRSELVIGDMHKRPLFPVWARGDNWVECVPMGRHSIQRADMRSDAYATGFARLVAALRGKGDFKPMSSEPAHTPSTPHPDNPYRGLSAFREADADRFLGVRL